MPAYKAPLRDARISTLYEGTTGIQALDLLGRKVLGSQGKALMSFGGIVREFSAANLLAMNETDFLIGS